jgi:hypothetical protein
VQLISHPFRLRADGTIATVEDGSEAADAQGIAVLALTQRGERDQLPSFGIPDPAFDELSLADLNVGLRDFGPPVTIESLDVTPTSTGLERVVLTFSRPDDDDQE